MLRLPGGLPVSLDLREISLRVALLEDRLEKLEAMVRARLKEEVAWALSEEEKIREADKMARSLR